MSSESCTTHAYIKTVKKHVGPGPSKQDFIVRHLVAFVVHKNEITSSFTPEVLVGEEDYDCVMICCKGFKILFILFILKSSFYMKRISTSTFFTYFITVMNTH